MASVCESTMKPAYTRPILMLLVMLGASILPGCLEAFNSNTAPSATFTIEEGGTLKAGMLLHFDASGSIDPEGDSLTFTWKFGDSNTATGSTATHTYNQQGDYTVTLTVSDGEFETKHEKNLAILSADASVPTAVIAETKDSDCDDESPPTGTFIMAWICDDMADNERDWNPSTTITLDASGSAAGSAEAWISSWKWDLDIRVDSDGDGTLDNDVDAEGETYQWATEPGEWKIRLTVTDDQGLSATRDMQVHVNARALWTEMAIGRNNSADNPRLDFTAPFTYDRDLSNKINHFKARIVYPKKDPGAGCGALCEQANRMDLYYFNVTDEEVRNSSATTDEARNEGDCSDDNYCLLMTASTGDFRTYLDGTWTVQIRNEKQHNAEVVELQIILKYK